MDFSHRYSNIIFKLGKVKNILYSNQDLTFFKYCRYFLVKKLYSLGLIQNTKDLKKQTISFNSFRKRKLKYILVKNQLAFSPKHALFLIKTKKVYIDSNLVVFPDLLIDRESEKKIILVK